MSTHTGPDNHQIVIKSLSHSHLSHAHRPPYSQLDQSMIASLWLNSLFRIAASQETLATAHFKVYRFNFLSFLCFICPSMFSKDSVVSWKFSPSALLVKAVCKEIKHYA